MIVALVVAVAENGVIGRDGALPWRLPADLRRFRALTLGHHVVMGRKTHASIGRALDGRVNVVLTSHPQSVAAGCVHARDLDQALAIAHAAGESEAMVIGGSSVYASALPHATRVHMTRVLASVPGDTTFPDLDPAQWHEVSRERHPADEKNAFELAFTVLERRAPAS